VVDAVTDVDFEIASASLTALVGESGSGKSTMGRCLAMLERTDHGDIWFRERKISELSDGEMRALRPQLQMIFQDSARALNPRFTATEIIAEPLGVQRKLSGAQLRSRACELMEEVGLSRNWADRRPLEFSGGQRQRLAIARAIALKPAFIVLDESLSGLDLSTQAQILNLLLDLQKAHALTYLLISHDLGLVGQVADYVAVMHQGRIVEQGPRQVVFQNPKHEHTQALLRSVRPLENWSRAAHVGGQS